MKHDKIILVLGLLAWVSATFAGSTNEFVWTVGTETNGTPIQQVQWLFHDQGLTKTNAPIWSGTFLTIIEQARDRVKVRCDKSALPSEQRWAEAIIQTNFVVGWIPRHELVKVPMSDWKKLRGSAQPAIPPYSEPAAQPPQR